MCSNKRWRPTSKSNDIFSTFGLAFLSFWLNDKLPRCRIDSNLTKLWNHQVSQSDEERRFSQSHSKACPTGQIANKQKSFWKQIGFAFVKFEQKTVEFNCSACDCIWLIHTCVTRPNAHNVSNIKVIFCVNDSEKKRNHSHEPFRRLNGVE